MIKLDPDEEMDEDDQPVKTPQKQAMPNTSQATVNDVTLNHTHVNNVQINLTRVNLPPDVLEQNFVSFPRFS
jgi:hypothetical protein